MTAFTLTTNEYRNIFELAANLRGPAETKLNILTIMEKISKEVNLNKPADNEFPESITIKLNKNELDAYWDGLVYYISDNLVNVDRILLIKALCIKLKLGKRFELLQKSAKIPDEKIPLDN